jgi:hypothetical protein
MPGLEHDMFISLAVLPLAAQLLLPVADHVPSLNVRPSCVAAASAAGAVRQNVQSCLDSEQHARDELVKQWGEFAPPDRARCVLEATLGGEPTYTELITCLEMARDARKMPESNEATMNGETPGPRDRARRH